MPFTPSHMAAALPFVRTPLLPSAIVIGTMAPDVPYYAPIGFSRQLTHSLEGVVTVDLLMTVVLVLLWYAVFRAPIVDLAPRAIAERMPPLGPLGWRTPLRSWPAAIVLLLAAAIVGALTHLAWDSFTHDGWLTEAVPALADRLGPLPLYKWLQHASTVAGLVILALWTRGWLRRTPRMPGRPALASGPVRVAAWLAVVIAFGGAGLAAWLWAIAQGEPPFDGRVVFLGATTAGGVAGLAGMLICVAWWVARGLRRT